MDITLVSELSNLLYIVIFFFVVCLTKLVYNLSVPYNTFTEIADKQNRAIAISVSGFSLAIAIIYCAVVAGPSSGLFNDVVNVIMYTIVGIFLLIFSRFINDKVLLHSFCNHQQLGEHQNVAVGISQAGCYLASGLIIAGAVTGEGTLWSALIFYVLGQLLLIIATKVYDWITPFELLTELKKQNSAAALSFAATLVAIGIILLHALIGTFESWQSSLILFAQDALIALVLLPIIRILVDKVMFPVVNLNQSIKEQQNTAIALLEGTVTISIAVVILFAL